MPGYVYIIHNFRVIFKVFENFIEKNMDIYKKILYNILIAVILKYFIRGGKQSRCGRKGRKK